jgi:hypothetical protein
MTKKERKALPEGFTPHHGGSPPPEITESTRVVLAIRTVDGVRFSMPGPAGAHIWEENLHDDGLGAVLGWKLADSPERARPPAQKT